MTKRHVSLPDDAEATLRGFVGEVDDRLSTEDPYEVVEDDLDWEEFFAIAKNEYPEGRDQIDARASAREAVSWVRDSLEQEDAGLGAGATGQVGGD